MEAHLALEKVHETSLTEKGASFNWYSHHAFLCLFTAPVNNNKSQPLLYQDSLSFLNDKITQSHKKIRPCIASHLYHLSPFPFRKRLTKFPSRLKINA